MSTSERAPPVLIEELEQSHEALETAESRVEEFGESSLRELADAYEKFRQLLEIYQDQVTGDDGDIKTIVEFQSQIDEVMSAISDDVLLSETFDECDEYLQQKWFNDADFEHVYEQLEPIADLVGRLDERDETLQDYRAARRDVERTARTYREEIADLERLASLTDADLDAPTERLEEPIERYNDAVSDAFAALRQNESAREVIVFLERMEAYPLVEFESPPEELARYVLDEPPGEEPVPKLLEYAEYSRSKLSHYVDDPDQLKHVLGHHRAYFDKLDAGPLRIEWPPPPATELHWQCQELTAAVNRIDPSVVEHLRTVAALPQKCEYDSLRDSAVVTQDLTEDERKRLESGDVETELETKRTEYERLEHALSEFPER